MTITATKLDSGSAPSATGAFNSNSFSITPNRWIVAAVSVISGNRSMIVTGTGLTFVQLSDGTFGTSRLSWHLARADSSGFTGTLTFTPNSSILQGHWCVVELGGVDFDSPVAQAPPISLGTSETTFTARMIASPADPGSRSIVVCAHDVFQNQAPGPGMVELADNAGNSPAVSFAVAWSDGDWVGAPSSTAATGGSVWAALAIEVRPPTFGSLPVPLLRGRRR